MSKQYLFWTLHWTKLVFLSLSFRFVCIHVWESEWPVSESCRHLKRVPVTLIIMWHLRVISFSSKMCNFKCFQAVVNIIEFIVFVNGLCVVTGREYQYYYQRLKGGRNGHTFDQTNWTPFDSPNGSTKKNWLIDLIRTDAGFFHFSPKAGTVCACFHWILCFSYLFI